MQHDARKGVHFNVRSISFSKISNLRLQVVRLDPRIALHQVNHLLARRDQLSFLHMALADRPVRRRGDLCVSEIDLGHGDGCTFDFNICPVNGIPATERIELTLFGFDLGLAARHDS